MADAASPTEAIVRNRGARLLLTHLIEHSAAMPLVLLVAVVGIYGYSLTNNFILDDYHCLEVMQATVDLRATRKNYPPMGGSLRALITHEFSRSQLNYPDAVTDGYTYLRLSPYKDYPFRSKLEHARVPVLIVHGSNDPLAYANEVAEFFSFTKNPNVAGVILNDGGHDGFAAYRRDYIYSMTLSASGFFWIARPISSMAAARDLPSS